MSLAHLLFVAIVSNGCSVFCCVIVQFQFSALLPRKVVLQRITLGIYIFTYVNYFLKSIFESRINGSKGLNIFRCFLCVFTVLYTMLVRRFTVLCICHSINLKPEEGIYKPFHHFVLLINAYYLVFIVHSSKHFMCIMQELIQTIEQPDGGAVSSIL